MGSVVGLKPRRGWKAAGALLSVYLLLIASITLAAPDKPWDAFPAGCPRESNCSRAARRRCDAGSARACAGGRLMTGDTPGAS